tara:strand:- start:6 stop:863 length:858 start_codon:yes stop_codon:yes gene_type:complete
MANRFLSNISINDEYTLPSADGTVDQIISTNGAGALSFIDTSTLDVGDSERVHIACKNTSGSTITKGTPVYITGTVGASYIIEVAPADAGFKSTMPAVGLLETDLVDNGEGYVIVSGVLKNVTTDPLSTGDGASSSNDTIYVKVGGGLTRIKPQTNFEFIQNVGRVGRVNSANAGSIAVSTIMRTNDVPNLTQGRVFVGTTYNTNTAQSIYLDETNLRLGVNTAFPTEALMVSGNARITGAYHDSSDSPGTSGQVLSSTATGTFWITSGGGVSNELAIAYAIALG